MASSTAIQRLLQAGILLVSLLACLLWQAATAASLLPDPTFMRLTSAQGLSQDGLNSLLIDQQGFLWIATDSGLNRYDGYHNQVISGAQNEFVNAPVRTLFQDSKGYLWVSTDSHGVYQFDLHSGKARQVVALKNAIDPEFYQITSHISEDQQGNIWFAAEQAVVKYSYSDDSIQTLFALPEQETQHNRAIRALQIHQGQLFVATSTGLLAIDLQSKRQQVIDYLPGGLSNPNRLNSKFLMIDQQRLWIGTVEGLYSLPLTATMDYLDAKGPLPSASLHVSKRNIWQIATSEDGLYYLATDRGLYRFDPASNQQQQLFLPSDSREYFASDTFKALAVDNNQNLWIASESDGALYWSPKALLFSNIVNDHHPDGRHVLSNTNVRSMAALADQSLWIGTRNGLNLLLPGQDFAQTFMHSSGEVAQFDRSSIAKIAADQQQNLWLLAGNSMVHFDSVSKTPIPLKVNKAEDLQILNDNVQSFEVLANGDLLLFNYAHLYRYSAQTGAVVKLNTLDNKVNIAKAHALIAPLAEYPRYTLLSIVGQLWAIDTQNESFSLWHSVSAEQHKSEIYPQSALIDKQGILWINYPGIGLYGLDSTSREQKYFFSSDNLLPTNAIYDLQLDQQGNIWMSSQAGILRFDPLHLQIQRYGLAQGLKNLDFNRFASITFADGRLAYGSPTGITVFDPTEFAHKIQGQNNVRISSVELSSKQLKLPMQDLSGQHLRLNHDDVGLTIHFSTLEYENQRNTRYRYAVSGTQQINYPETRIPAAIFPKLDPGDYQFSVMAYDSVDGNATATAQLYISVNYPPWASPLAYTFYALLGAIALITLMMRKRYQDSKLQLAHLEVLESKNKLTLALSASNSGVWQFQVTEKLFYAPRISNELGYNQLEAEIPYEQHLALIHHQDRVIYESQWTKFFSREDKDLDVTFRMRSADGQWLWFRDLGSAVKIDAQGNPLLITGTYTNITDDIANQENLRVFGEAFKHTHDWVVIYNHKLQPIAVNDAFKGAFDLDDDSNLSNKLQSLQAMQSPNQAGFWRKLSELQVNQQWQGEDSITLTNASRRDVLVQINVIANSQDESRIEYYLLILSDISEQKRAEEKLRRLANFDALTGLPNRTLLLDRVERGLEHANRHHKSMALFFIDLDRFKQVNDSLGHKAGDELLKIVARRLTAKLRKEDTVARLGGDEFVIMIEDVKSIEAISRLVSEIIAIIDLPILLSNQTVSVSSSIGIAMYPGDGASAEELLKHADIAMYHAKELGRSNFQFFTAQMDNIVKERLVLENRLKTAHKQKRFINNYQPIVDIETGRVEGFEILMRWPTRAGLVPPSKFIPIAEELGLIEMMTLDAFERALPVMKDLRSRGFDGYMSVNLSARHFENQASIDRIMLILELHHIPVSAIRFEITESALMRDYEKALDYMSQIKQKGFLIALDDFGTGYSSLKYLKEFPINVIKVDKSFVEDIGKNKNNESIILTTLSMARQLGMSCVAEGIERAEQVTFFRLHDCAHLQGYFFSKPVGEECLPGLITRNWSEQLGVDDISI